MVNSIGSSSNTDSACTYYPAFCFHSGNGIWGEQAVPLLRHGLVPIYIEIGVSFFVYFLVQIDSCDLPFWFCDVTTEGTRPREIPFWGEEREGEEGSCAVVAVAGR